MCGKINPIFNMYVFKSFFFNWLAKWALSGEMDRKLRIAKRARMWCIYIYAVRS